MANQPTLELELAKPVELCLNFDTPKTGEGEYGTWYLYSVTMTATGEKFSWFAPAPVHEIIAGLGLKKNAKFTVVKQAIEKDGKLSKKHVLIYDEHVYDSGETGVDSATLPIPSEPVQAVVPAVTKPTEPPVAKPELPSVDERIKTLGNRLYQCLEASQKLCQKLNEKNGVFPFGPGEVERIGVALFIELNRGGGF